MFSFWMSLVFYSFLVMKCLFFLFSFWELTKWPKCKILIYIVVDKKNTRANNENGSRGDWKFSQLSIKLMLNLTEQLSMHLFDLDKWKVVKKKSLACPWMVERTTVCTEKKYFLFYLFYFIKVYTDFISWGKKTLYSVSLFLSPWLTHKATTSSAFAETGR